MTELKPCPFCGGKAEMVLFIGNFGVGCTNCMGSMFPVNGQTKEEAIKAWNRRAGEQE
ncbi:MAG: Lar family restriction alleviation protein [Emergencia sp.]